MKITLPSPPERYSPEIERARNDALRNALEQTRGRREHLEVSPPEMFIMTSPDGTRWSIGVSDAGAFTATAV